jgi:hypothetical protein
MRRRELLVQGLEPLGRDIAHAAEARGPVDLFAREELQHTFS